MSKPQKRSRVDRISSLPDSLLCHILSFLRTKEVVATSILSSRWTTLWTHVPYLHFKDPTNRWNSKSGDNDKTIRFTHFVSRVLTLLKAPTVETFRLKCDAYIDPLHVNTWICAALGRGVKELDLSSYGWNEIQLPRSAFNCESLVVLKLSRAIFLKCPSSIHLPSLKILHLLSVIFEHGDSVDRLFSGCPVLEDLHAEISVRHETTFNIFIPTLKRLRVHIRNAYSDSKVQINTPSLDDLVIRDPFPADYLLNKLPNLVEARVDTSNMFNKGEDYGDCVLKLLRGLYNVKILSFSYATRGFYITFDDPPLFHNLVNLKLGVYSFDCHVIKTLLENSPNLKVLDIDKKVIEGCKSRLSQAIRIPECLSSHSHLETFIVRGFEGWEHELEIVEYILKNAQVLVIAAVYTRNLLDFEIKFNLTKKLLMFPRGSKICQLEFH